MDDSALERSNRPPRAWPEEGLSRIPYWVYSDPEVYALEQTRIFSGAYWDYVALEAEIPKPGDFVRSHRRRSPVVVVRDRLGDINVMLNRCAHRGVQFCRRDGATRSEFMCPYHQWTYDLRAILHGVPFRRGVHGQGGMPEDFDPRGARADRLGWRAATASMFASFDSDRAAAGGISRSRRCCDISTASSTAGAARARLYRASASAPTGS